VVRHGGVPHRSTETGPSRAQWIAADRERSDGPSLAANKGSAPSAPRNSVSRRRRPGQSAAPSGRGELAEQLPAGAVARVGPPCRFEVAAPRGPAVVRQAKDGQVVMDD